ncbi:RidA family protein [Salipiger abyssi]|uniref:RidA family protein n=1 Tax=Salipiger abyssi TaxID=1250539 RepID=UPI001A8CCFE1|nr:RidA family protein [Salipiger abyssi]MBN9887065.1 RidA family protein [Salipiger abyssi]
MSVLERKSETAIADRLAELGVELPAAAPDPIGAFCNVRQTGNLVYVSGQGPVLADGTLLRGKVGREIGVDEARDRARLVAVNILGALRDHLGGLERVTGVIKLLGLVNASPDFERHPAVIDGASTLLADVFGQTGVHARSAFGVASLPNDISVEIEAIFEIGDAG